MIRRVWTYRESEIESTCLELQVIRETDDMTGDVYTTVIVMNHDPDGKQTIDLPSEVATDLVRWLSAIMGET